MGLRWLFMINTADKINKECNGKHHYFLPGGGGHCSERSYQAVVCELYNNHLRK
jgi:hypothetical protein